jgi:hypothetical protein
MLREIHSGSGVATQLGMHVGTVEGQRARDGEKQHNATTKDICVERVVALQDNFWSTKARRARSNLHLLRLGRVYRNTEVH